MPLESDLFNNFMEMEREKSEGEGITYLGTFAGYEIFSRARETLIASSKEGERERYAVMNSGMFHKQTHICRNWKDLWRKIKHNKEAKKLCQICNYRYE